MAGAGAHVIDINRLIISMTREHDSAWLGDKFSEEERRDFLIHRVNLHDQDKHRSAYSPYILSIGPYNYGIPATRAMQKMKYKFLNHIVNLRHEIGLPKFLEAMKGIEEKVRNCYASEIYMDRNEFLKMLLLDGCFILISFNGIEQSIPDLHEPTDMTTSTGEVTDVEATSQSTPCNAKQEFDEECSCSCPTDPLYSQAFWHDMLLLENQIPFFVITKMHELITGGSDKTPDLVETFVVLIEAVLRNYPNAISKSNRPKTFFHLLHLCHMYFRPHFTQVEHLENYLRPPLFHNLLQLGSRFFSKFKEAEQQQATPWHSATQYHRVGINIKKRMFCPENPHSLLDILFYNGIIEIPCLTIDTDTYSLLCNLTAFERSCTQFGCHVTAYVTFISCLLSKSDDVSFLTKKGIVMHQLNSDAEVADLFRTIAESLAFDFNSDHYLKPLCHRIEAYYQSKRPVFRELIGSVASNVYRWTKKNDSPDSLTTTSEEILV